MYSSSPNSMTGEFSLNYDGFLKHEPLHPQLLGALMVKYPGFALDDLIKVQNDK